jgi:predicted DNA-binding transcriptional regulator AlpA
MVGGLMVGFFLLAKEVMELLGPSQSTFGDLVGELGLSEGL